MGQSALCGLAYYSLERKVQKRKRKSGIGLSNECKEQKREFYDSRKGRYMDILVYQAKRHDKEAFGKLMKMHAASMYKVAKAILKNDDDVADAIQETALTCWEKVNTLRKDKYFKTWLTRILINNCNAIYRQRNRMLPADEIPESGTVEESYAQIEWQEFLQCLDEKYRIVTMLYYVEGFKIREIAEVLEINENTVSTRLAKARKIMEKQYR